MSDKKFKITMLLIAIIGILLTIGLMITTIYLFKNASMVEVISRMG